MEIHFNVEGRGFSPARVAVRWFIIVLRPVSSMPPFPLLSVGLDLPLPLDLLEEVAAAAAAAAGPTCMFIVPPPPPRPKPAARQDFPATITGHEKCLSGLCVGGAGWRRKKFFFLAAATFHHLHFVQADLCCTSRCIKLRSSELHARVSSYRNSLCVDTAACCCITMGVD